MFTQCPECHTIYAVDAATLAQAHGNVGCGQCGATFNALATLVENQPEDADDTLPIHPHSPGQPILMVPVAQAAAAAAPAAPAAPEEAEWSADELAVEALLAASRDNDETDATPLPSFVRRAQSAHRARHRRWWVAACVALACLLGVQVVWAERVPLTINDATRPWLARACSWFGCTLPAVRDRADLKILSRDVRPHPGVPGALLISATVRNDAPFTQPYPVVSITLSDLDQNRIAMRRFRPSEYIADPVVRAAGLAPGATAALMFEVKDPGRNAVAFEFGFQ